MISRPVIFISAVGQELRGARDLVAKTLTSLGCEPKWQDIAPAETGDLRRRVDDAAAVVQLVGHRYGDEPREPDPEFGRVSYTQYEALYARRQGKQVWYLSLAPGHPIEPDSPAEPAELRKLQEAYRRQVLRTGLCHESADPEQTRKIILKLCKGLPELQRARKQARVRWAAHALLLLALTAFGVWRGKQENDRISQPPAEAPEPGASPQLPSTPRETDLPAKLSQVQEALSRLQQNADPKSDPIGQWPQERLERELAGQLQLELKDLRAMLSAGQTSLDLLLQGQALLASGKASEAGKRFDLVLQQKTDETKRLRQAYVGKAQIAFAAVKYEDALHFREKAAALVDKTVDPLAWASAHYWVAHLDRLLARYREAEPLLKELVRLWNEQLGPNHAHFAVVLNELALLYSETNRLGQAEPLLVQALKIDEKLFGPEHPSVATELGNLGGLFLKTNRLGQAEPLLVRALRINEQKYGPTHARVAGDLNNLAQLYEATNRRAEAEPLMERALKIEEQSRGPVHPEVATCLGNLAGLYMATKRLAEAEPLMERALKIDEQSFGPEHPSVALRLNNLAQLYKATDRVAEAEPLMDRALKLEMKSFGPQHPNVARDLNNLARLYKDTNRLAEAEPLMERALEIREQSYGPEHPEVAVSLNSLASLYVATNRLAEAEAHARRALQIGLKSTHEAGHVVGDLKIDVSNYRWLLRKLAVPDAEIPARFSALGEEAGFTHAETQALLAEIIGRSPKP